MLTRRRTSNREPAQSPIHTKHKQLRSTASMPTTGNYTPTALHSTRVLHKANHLVQQRRLNMHLLLKAIHKQRPKASPSIKIKSVIPNTHTHTYKQARQSVHRSICKVTRDANNNKSHPTETAAAIAAAIHNDNVPTSCKCAPRLGWQLHRKMHITLQITICAGKRKGIDA